MRIAILGGGLSGLVTAYRLSQASRGCERKLEIHVFEAREKFGGVIQTEQREGFLMEGGPDSFITAKPWAMDLCKELGLEQAFLETNPDQRQSFILSNNQLLTVPRGFYLMAPTDIKQAIKTPLLSWRGKIRMCLDLLIPRKKNQEDESLASFVKRRFGRELLEKVAQPMIAGIYTADPEDLSLEATFPHFLKLEQEHGSVIRGMAKRKDAATNKASGPRYSLFLSLTNGIHSLIAKLIAAMPHVHFHASHKVTELEKTDTWNLVFESGKHEKFDAVCLALPAPSVANLLGPLNQDLAENLKQIPYETVATVNLVFKREEIGHPLNGLGYVVPAIENKKIVGCTFSSIKFSGRSDDPDSVLLRAFVGGKEARQLLQLNDQEVLNHVLGEIQEQLQISAKPKIMKLSRWKEAIPQYHVGHKKRVNRIFEALKTYQGLYLTGNAYEGTGIPDCIHHASQTAHQILEDHHLSKQNHIKESKCATL